MKNFLIILSLSLMISLAGVLNVHAADNEQRETYLTEEIQDACIKYGEEYKICPELLMAIIERESRGVADAENKGCKGLMQINVRFHTERMERLGVTDIYSVDGNVHVGADYLAELFKEYGEIYLVLMAYNMGPEKAESLWKQEKISKYALAVAGRSEQLERIHGK